MPPSRKRRAVDDASADEPPPGPSQHRRAAPASPADDDGDDDVLIDSELGTTALQVKKMVRLALASEYARLPIRRADLSSKVLGERSRAFKPVFAGAQKALADVFGMQMTEQPLKEKFSISQRRAAQRVEKPSTTSKSWTLISTLPAAYRAAAILPPNRAPSSALESSYVALYSFVVALVTLSGGAMAEQKLDRYLRRVGADAYTPVDRTDRLLARMCRDGYLVRNRDVDAGEEIVDYHVGPRGKVEVGAHGVAGLARVVYGFDATSRRTSTEGEDAAAAAAAEEEEEFEQKLRRSLGVSSVGPLRREEEEEGEGGDGEASSSNRPARPARGGMAVLDVDDDDED
ncbi:hypothetical protein LOZ58_001474 [Ophidiomyces ophidiicola]|nr:hypothetical protein LOZ58_001474 [Ophidiomyces ophidiicola]